MNNCFLRKQADGMKSKRIYLHIGLHKTGTTLIQKMLGENLEALSVRGITCLRTRGDYPASKLVRGFWGGKPALEEALRRGADRAFRKELEDLPGDRLVVSEEDIQGKATGPNGSLYPMASRAAECMAKVCASHETTVIIYLREQASFFESFYVQRVKQGGSLSFAEYLEDLDLDRLSWRPLVQAWRREFGRVVVRRYEDIFSEGRDAYLRRFMRSVAPGFAPVLPADSRANAGYSEEGLRIARHANRFLDADQRKRLRKFLERQFSNTEGNRPGLFSEAQKADLREKYHEENEALLGGEEVL